MTLVVGSARRRTPATPPPDIPTSAPYNVATHLTIPTYDGSNQPVHPDVIDFGFGTPWHGWRFWMVMTPYPNYDASWEDPSIVVSNDGLTWQVPAGLTNPPYRPVEGPYNNDPDIVHDPITDELVLFYRDYDVPKTARSSDGITWPTTPTTIEARIGVSPSYLRRSDGVWLRWTPTGLSSAPAAEGPYTDVGAYTGLTNAWHYNVAPAPGGGYHMIYHDDSDGQKNVKLASSANGYNWTVNTTPVLVSGTQPWSMSNLYRPAFTLHEDGDRYRVWYCGVSPDGAQSVWRIGCTEIPLTEWPTIP